MTLVRADGSTAFFELDPATDTFITPPGSLYQLQGGAAGSPFWLRNRWGDQWTFSSYGLLDTFIDRYGDRTRYVYTNADSGVVANDLAQIVEHDITALSRTTNYVYVDGLLSKVVDSAGRETLVGHDAAGQLTSITLPDPDAAGPLTAPVTTFAYDADGLLTQITDAEANSATIEYDFARRFKKITRPHASSWELRSIDVVGLPDVGSGQGTQANPAPLAELDDAVATYTDPLGRVSTVQTDRFGYAGCVTDPLAQMTRYGRDADGQITSISEPDPDGGGPLGRPITQIEYNDLSLPTRTIRPDGEVTTFGYATVGIDHLIASIKGPGYEWAFSYYNYEVTGPAPRRIEDRVQDIVYDLVGANIVKITDGRDLETLFDYDARNRLTQVTDELGKQTRYQYDVADNVTRVTDRLGHSTDYAYDRLDRLVTVTDALADPPTRYGYDAVGNLVQVILPLGAATTFDYDGLRRLTKATNPLLKSTSWQYDAASNVTEVKDAQDRRTTYVYDALDRATSVTDFLGHSTDYAYDAAGRVTQMTNARDFATSFAYDIMGRLIRATNAVGDLQTIEYNAAGQLTARTDELGRRTNYTRDARGLVTRIAEPLGRTTDLTYDGAGNLTWMSVWQVGITGGRGVWFAYDALNRLSGRAQGGTLESFGYDDEDRLLSYTEPGGRVTHFQYDALGRLSGEIDVLGYERRHSYDAEGRQIKIEGRDSRAAADPWTTKAEYSYDAAGRVTSFRDAAGGLATFEYDGVDRIVRYVDPLGRELNCTYGDSIDPWTVTGTEGVTDFCSLGGAAPWKRTYDEVGNLVAVVDPMGNKTRYDFDPLNQVTQMIDGRNGQTHFAYDPVGNLTSLTDPVGNSTSYEYDALDRATRETNELGLSRHYEYDALDQVRRLTDRNGGTREFGYDARGRLTSEYWPGATSASGPVYFNYSYDAAGRMIEASDLMSESRYTYAYDDAARTATTTFNDRCQNTSCSNRFPHVAFTEAYDAQGQRTALEATVEGVRDFTNGYQYDALGRMTQVIQYGVAGGNAVAEKRVDFQYNPLGMFTSIVRYNDLAATQPVATTTFDYDNLGRLDELTHRQPAGAIISQYTYTHDDLDRITSVTGPDGTTNYTYDETSQLLSAVHTTPNSPLPDESYSYDLNGNRTNTGYVTAADNRLDQAEIDGVLHSFQYDAEGNLVRQTNLTSGEITDYTWDRRNRLTSVARRSATGTILVQVDFTYDAFDRRIAKTVDPDGAGPQGPSSEVFVYDGIHIALVFTDPDAGDPQSSILDSRLLYGPAVDQVLSEEQIQPDGSAKNYWLLSDHLGSIRDIISPNCVGGGHIDYTAFGRVAAVFDYLGNPSTLNDLNATRFLFTDREYDAELDLQYNRARYYNGAIGRWLSQDPISFAGGDANLYRYVGNRTIDRTDSSGLMVADPDQDFLDELDARGGRRKLRPLDMRSPDGVRTGIAISNAASKLEEALTDAALRGLGVVGATGGISEAVLGVTCALSVAHPLAALGCLACPRCGPGAGWCENRLVRKPNADGDVNRHRQRA